MTHRPPRRALLRAIASLGAAGVTGYIFDALAAGDGPATPGINRMEGSVSVNGKPARVGTPVSMGDKVATGAQSQAVVLLKGDAFLMRPQTIIEIKGGREGLLNELTIATGKVLSVFGKRPIVVRASSATIGIRGTGAYIEALPDEVYFCLCYGEALLEVPGLPARIVKTTHHEEPLLVSGIQARAEIAKGPFRDHKDEELVMLEALCGREPPFMKDGAYPLNKY
jgi:hypothetical protein